MVSEFNSCVSARPLRWSWDGTGSKAAALKAAWNASQERYEVVAAMSLSERSKRRLEL